MIKLLKNILFVFIPIGFLMLYCDDPDELSQRRYGQYRDTNIDPIRSVGTENYYGRYNSLDYKGPDCEDLEKNSEDYEECMEICKKLYDREYRSCENLPESLISKFDDVFTELSRISERDSELGRRINDFDFGVMIDIHIEPALKLIEDWSPRETTSFLIWVAKTTAVSLALYHHDKENEILEEAFKKLADGFNNNISDVEYGMASNLQGAGQTFLTLAEAELNPAAYVIFHRLLKDICSTKSCKLKNYCRREEFDRRTRIRQCHYSSSRRPTFNRERACYIHGPGVWSYWVTINNEGDFDDSDFPVDSSHINEEECNRICTTEDCTRH